MKQLETMKQQLTSLVEGQMSNIYGADCNELGQAIDMIKDLSEAIYYCTITEAMKEKEPQVVNYYTEPRERYRPTPMDHEPIHYYGGNGNGENNYYTDPMMGRSGNTRKMYMESKEMNTDKMVKLKELDKYMKELSTDITEMIEDASPEERQLLQQKLVALSNKIQQV